jgi:hypothetical protein
MMMMIRVALKVGVTTGMYLQAAACADRIVD